MSKHKVICWWSGGITSAVACKIAIDLYGVENCEAIMMDTRNEDLDTYRFKKDCEKWYGLKIGTIDNFGDKYESIEDVWVKNLSLNVAKGAVCSSELKRRAREKWQKVNEYRYQVFGFEFNTKEFKRALALKLNHSKAKPIFPLLMLGYDKEKCIEIVQEAGIEIPRAYSWGFHNNNCLGSTEDTGGCVQGGAGYYQLLREKFPRKYIAMAKMEHKLTNLKGQPVTMLKDQSNEAKEKAKDDKTSQRVFLEPHPDYPNHKSLKDIKGRPVEPLVDCNGFCGVDDLLPNSETQNELALFGEIE